MKIIEKKFKEKHFSSNILNAYLGGKSFAIFDIETTGLSPKYNKIILAGILVETGDGLLSRQILAENQSEEKILLQELIKELSKYDYLVTYNGAHFDIPFIEARFKHYGIIYNGPWFDLDIFQFVSGYSPLRKVLTSLSQKSVEEYLGLSSGRDDKINGRESVILYNEYEATRDPILEKVICLHNSDDVLQLYKVQSVLLKCDIHKGFNKLGFPINSTSYGLLKTRQIDLLRGRLRVRGSQHSHEATDYVQYESIASPVTMRFDGLERIFEISIPITRKPKGVYIKLSDFGLCNEHFSHLSGYTNGYLIFENEDQLLYEEINAFVMALLK